MNIIDSDEDPDHQNVNNYSSGLPPASPPCYLQLLVDVIKTTSVEVEYQTLLTQNSCVTRFCTEQSSLLHSVSPV